MFFYYINILIYKMQAFIDSELNEIMEKLEKILLNLNKLTDIDIKMYKNFNFKIKILKFLRENYYEKYKFFLVSFFYKNNRLFINKFKYIDNLKSLYVIDNLYDFKFPVKASNIDILTRETIIEYLLNNNENDMYAKQIYDIIGYDIYKNKVDDVSTMEKIFSIFSMKKLLDNDGSLLAYKQNNEKNKDKEKHNIDQYKICNSNVYFETRGLFKSSLIYCPFKKALDSANCSCDTMDIRKKFNFNTSFNIDNYDDNLVEIMLNKENVFMNIEKNIKYYYPFIDNMNIINEYSIQILINDKKNIYKLKNNNTQINRELKNNITIFKNEKLNKKEIKKQMIPYIKTGTFLKRFGDHSQIEIFNKSSLYIFQTFDRYCFLHACLISKSFKLILLESKILYTKINFNKKIYGLTLNVVNYYNIVEIKKKLIEFIKKINLNNIKQYGGIAFNVKRNNIFDNNSSIYKNFDHNKKLFINKKIENNILLNNINIEMNKKELIKLIDGMVDNPLSYLLYKIDIDKYKETLGNNFEFVNDIINNLKNFSNDISYDSTPKKIRLLLQSIINIAKYNNKIKLLDKKDIKFIKVIKKINELDDKKIRNKSMGILQIIRNFWKYEKKIEDTDTIKQIIKKTYNQIHENHKYDDIEDVDISDLIANENEELDVNSDEYKKTLYNLGKIKLSDDELFAISERLNEKVKIRQKIYEERVNKRYKLHKKKDKELEREYEEHRNDNSLIHLKNFCKKLISHKLKKNTNI